MRKLILFAASAVFLFWACDLQKTVNQIQASKVMVGTLLSTPPVDMQPLSHLNLDAGVFPPDAGSDAGTVTVPGQTVAYVFFGSRGITDVDAAPEPITDAKVTVAAQGGTTTEIPHLGAGNYTKTSIGGEFPYESGKTYEFIAQVDSERFIGEVKEAPQAEHVAAFHPPKGYVEHTANTAFTFTRPEPTGGGERNVGFISVYPLGENGERGDATYTNHPKEPLDFLRLVAEPSQWKQASVTIPGSAFPKKDTTYMIVLQAVKTGGPQSENLFTGSALLAGTADVGLIRTQ